MNIGVAAYSDKGSCSINTAYLKYVSDAGFNPILITKQNDMQKMVDLCDGLLLPGGVDINPTFYGENNIASSSCSPAKDDFERDLMVAFSLTHKNIFGICRGFQLIAREFLRRFPKACPNHYFYQHIQEHNLVSARGVERDVPTHSLKMNIEALYGIDAPDQELFVNSIHHQALTCSDPKHLNIVADQNNRLRTLAVTNFYAPKLGTKETVIIEAIDVMLDGTKMRGVQWHPEELVDTQLLRTFFIDQAANIQADVG